MHGLRVLFLIDRPPRDACWVQEQLDMILAALALEQSVSVVFVAEGVYHCLAPDRRPEKDYSAPFGSLALYDVHRLVIEDESLVERNLAGCPLRFDPEVLPRRQIRELLGEQDLLL